MAKRTRRKLAGGVDAELQEFQRRLDVLNANPSDWEQTVRTFVDNPDIRRKRDAENRRLDGEISAKFKSGGVCEDRMVSLFNLNLELVRAEAAEKKADREYVNALAALNAVLGHARIEPVSTQYVDANKVLAEMPSVPSQAMLRKKPRPTPKRKPKPKRRRAK